MTTPRDSYSQSCRELGSLLTLSEISVEGGFEPLTIGSMRKNHLTKVDHFSHVNKYLVVQSFNVAQLHSKAEENVMVLKNFSWVVFDGENFNSEKPERVWIFF